MALGDIHLRFAWQAWHLLTSTSTLVLRGKRGAWSHPPSFRVACGALRDIYFRFAWQAWRLWPWAGSGGDAWARLGAGDAAQLCVAGVAGVALGDIDLGFGLAGVALGDIYLCFAWRVWLWAGSGGALGRAWSPVTPLKFAQAWRLATSTLVLRGRRGTS